MLYFVVRVSVYAGLPLVHFQHYNMLGNVVCVANVYRTVGELCT